MPFYVLASRGHYPASTKLVLAFCFAIAIASSIPTAFAGFYYTLNGELKSQRTVQMWYEGYWKEVGWVNGTIVKYPSDNVRDRIVIIHKQRQMKIEQIMRQLAPLKPKAVIWAVEVRQKDHATPGSLMLMGTDGKDRSSINFPVAEAEYFNPNNFTLLPEGTFIEALWEENRWKTTLDTHFQTVIAAIFLSFWEALIIIFGLFRIYQFYLSETNFSIFSIGPLCLLCEVLGCSIRLAHTLGDPFFAERRYPMALQTSLSTIHLPFTFSCGILLTFFWAETLSKSNVHATPFISKYRGTTIICLSAVVIAEIVATTVRALDLGTVSTIMTYIHIFFYMMLTFGIIASYIVCAVAIWKRIGSSGTRKNRQIKNLTVRFGLSILGYILFVGFLIGIGVNGTRVVVFHLMYDFAYMSLNWVATLQIWALRPPRIRYHKASRSGKTTSSDKPTPEDTATATIMDMH